MLKLNHVSNGEIGLVAQVDADDPGGERAMKEFLETVDGRITPKSEQMTAPMGEHPPVQGLRTRSEERRVGKERRWRRSARARRRRHTKSKRDWSSDVCSSDLCSSSTTTLNISNFVSAGIVIDESHSFFIATPNV